MNQKLRIIFLCSTMAASSPIQGAFIPSEEAIFKALNTLQLTHYTLVSETFSQKIKGALSEPQFSEINEAYTLLSTPTVKAVYETEQFLTEFHLKAKDKKIDSFRVTYGIFKGHIVNLTQAFENAYNSQILDPSYLSLDEQQMVGKMLLKKYLTHFYQAFIQTNMTYRMDVSQTESLIHEVRDSIKQIDPNNTLGNQDLQIIEAMKTNLKTMSNLPGWIQAIIRKTMAKKEHH